MTCRTGRKSRVLSVIENHFVFIHFYSLESLRELLLEHLLLVGRLREYFMHFLNGFRFDLFSVFGPLRYLPHV